ncbi:YraN family protein [Microbacterium sp. HD4P20]|uniref:YraN family protein n=1 Tax=Microbacterium sp. HD4P20 TaxID=2864874 RepID=UPI001C6419F6|nr:YraN family protein [Microbacterium sp. HD4P20]MCP2636693.1 YraN family protein [Microbacterium sp. HD4P20]
MADKDVLGRAGEDRAAHYLRQLGFEILDRNWRRPAGEIDLVVADSATVVIVEVKTRRGEAYGHPFEALDARKRARLWRLAVAWAAAHRDQIQGRRLRIDAVGLIGAEPATARLEHLVDLEVP